MDIPYTFFSDDFRKKKRQYKTVSDELHAFYADKIGEEFASFIREEGLCSYDSGLFTVLDPLVYNEILKEYSVYSPQSVALVKNAFGDIFYFDGYDCRILYTSHNENYAFASGDAVKYFFTFQLTDSDFANENLKKRMFRQALKLHGELKEDESYGFIPALPLGGNEKAATTQKVKTLEYLSLLSQLFKE